MAFKSRRSWLRTILPLVPGVLRFPLIRSLVRVKYDIPPELEMRIARTREELSEAYRILHDAYVDEGYMKPNEAGMRITKYFALPSTTTLIALWEGKVVGTISIIRRTSFGLPIESVFDISEHTQNEDAVAEVSSLAIAKEFRTQRGAMFFPLCRYFYQYSRDYLRLQKIVIVVNPKMADFYEGILGFKRLDSKVVSEYDFANGNPAVGMWADIPYLADFMHAHFSHLPLHRNLYHFFLEFPMPFIKFPSRRYIKASDPVMSSEDLNYFFVENSNVFETLTARERQELASLYPLYFSQNHVKNELPVNRVSPRFLVETSADALQPFFGKIRIIDISASGVRLQLNDKLFKRLSEQALIARPVLQLRVQTAENSYATISGAPRWYDTSNFSIGLEVTDFDTEWLNYIAYLTFDLSVKKVV